MDPKRKVILDRIASLEESIKIATEYLKTGKHADWRGFRPFFDRKFKDGRALPPHKDWVKNVYLPGMARSLDRAEKILQRHGEAKSARRAGRPADAVDGPASR